MDCNGRSIKGFVGYKYLTYAPAVHSKQPESRCKRLSGCFEYGKGSLKADLAVISANKKGSLKTFQAAFCHNDSCFLWLSFQAAYISASALKAFSRWPFCGGRLCAGNSSR